MQTYAYLRARQPEVLPVAAGILIYVNELAPEQSNFASAQREVRNNWTDVIPAEGSSDWYQLQTWTPGTVAQLSEAYRYARALRIVPVTPNSVEVATGEFDRIVTEIETCVQTESERGSITQAWQPTCQEEETCVACDFFNFCPRPASGADPSESIDPDDGI